jgi:hypothetical protein
MWTCTSSRPAAGLRRWQAAVAASLASLVTPAALAALAASAVAAAPAAGVVPVPRTAPLELAQNLESTIIPDPARAQGYSLGYPRRKPGLWEIRNASGDAVGMPPTSYCVGDRTDTPENHLDRAAGEKGSCTIGPFKLVGISWVAESVCKESRSVVVSQSIASGDFQTQYRIDTLVFYSPPLANNKREDRESVVARYLGPCGAGHRPGDLIVPGMGVLNMGDGTLQQAPRR